MARANTFRSEFTGAQLRAPARQFKDALQAGRLQAQAVIYDGGVRGEATLLNDLNLPIVRD